MEERARLVEAVRGIARMVRAYDLVTFEHAEAVGALAGRVAFAMGLDEATVTRTELAGELHDLGLIALERSILDKPTELVEAERAEIRMHPAIGAATLERVPLLAVLAPIVAAHHERPDGTGYPAGMPAHEIPVESKIVAVVDAFHAMTVPHAYRAPRSVDDALDAIAAGAGPQFDRIAAKHLDRLIRALAR